MRQALSLSLAILMTLTSVAAAESSPSLPRGPSFRVETELFEGDSVQPAARHLILFDGGVIYDLRLDDTRTATMYDPARGRVVVIDRARSQHAVISTEQLVQATGQLRAAVVQEGKGEVFGLDAQVITNSAASPDEPPKMEIGFGAVRYETTVQQVKNSAIPAAYNHFANLAAQLNVVRRIGVAPFARMTLGQHIADAGWLPLETVLEVRGGLRKQRYRSRLLVVEQLSASDRDRINDLGRILAASKEVSLDEIGK